jgi:hypothetical protein
VQIGLKYTPATYTCAGVPVCVSSNQVRTGAEFTPGKAMNAPTRFAILLVLGIGAHAALAQSLGDVARQVRNTPHPRAKRVVTNDEIPSADTSAASEKKTAEAKDGDDKSGKADGDKNKADAKAPAASTAPKTAEDQKKLEAEWNAKFATQQEKIALLEREYKVSEQEYKQKQLAHIGDVNGRVNNQQQYAEAEKLDREELAQKQEKLNTERAKLEAMQEDARHAGVKVAD